MLLLCVFLVLSPPATMTGANSMARVVEATRPLETKSPSYNTLKPKTSHGQGGFHGRDVENCLPKGFHQTSAPSRYINYHTFGSEMCTAGKNVNAP